MEDRPALGRESTRPYSADDVIRLRGTVKIEYTLARLGAERLWKLLRTEPYIRTLGAQTGAQAVQMVQAGLKAIYVSGWQVAGDMNTAAADLSRPEPLSGRQRADAGPADQQRLAAGRPDRPQRGHQRPDALLVRPDRGRRRGRLRRRAERLRADEGDDRGRRGRRPLRGPDSSASKKCGHMGGKVLVPTQEAIQQAGRRPPGRRRARTCPRCSSPAPTPWRAKLLTSDIDQRDRPFLTGERTAEGFYVVRAGHRAGHRPRPGLRPLRRHGLVRDLARPTWTRPGSSPRRSTTQYPGQAAGLQLLAVVQLEAGAGRASRSPRFQREPGDDGLQVPVRHPGRLPRPQHVACSSWPTPTATRACWPTRRLQQREFELERDHGYRAVKHQSFVGAGYFDAVTQIVTAGQSPARWPSTARPSRRSSPRRRPTSSRPRSTTSAAATSSRVPPASPLVEKPDQWQPESEAVAQPELSYT